METRFGKNRMKLCNRPSIYSFIHPFIHQSIYSSFHPSLHQSIYSSIHLSIESYTTHIYPFTKSSSHPSSRPSTHPPVRPPIHPPIHPLTLQPGHSSIHPSSTPPNESIRQIVSPLNPAIINPSPCFLLWKRLSSQLPLWELPGTRQAKRRQTHAPFQDSSLSITIFLLLLLLTPSSSLFSDASLHLLGSYHSLEPFRIWITVRILPFRVFGLRFFSKFDQDAKASLESVDPGKFRSDPGFGFQFEACFPHPAPPSQNQFSKTRANARSAFPAFFLFSIFPLQFLPSIRHVRHQPFPK